MGLIASLGLNIITFNKYIYFLLTALLALESGLDNSDNYHFHFYSTLTLKNENICLNCV